MKWGAEAASPPPLPGLETKSGGGNLEPFNRLIGENAERNPLSRPMAQSVWVMSAIEKIAEPICQSPLEFFMMDQDGSEKPYQRPELKAFWAKPGKGLPWTEFVRASVGWWNLYGEIFYILDDTWLLRSVRKSPIIVPSPLSMREIVDRETDTLEGWQWMQPNGQRATLDVDQVIQVKRWNPYNKWRGLSKMEAARVAAEADYLQGRFAGNLARNNGDQGVFVVAKGNMPTDDQQRQIIMSLRMKREAALKGELRPVFLTGDIDIKDPMIQTPDADFVAQRVENRHEIYNAFGVPMSMADVTASYSIGSASDRFILIEDTCMPMAKTLADPIADVSKRLLRVAPETPLQAGFNFSKHSVIVQARLEMLGAADKLWGKGVPMKVCNDYLGLQLPEFKDWDQGYLPFNVTPVGEEAPDPSALFAETAKPEPDDEDEDPSQGLEKIFAQRRASQTVDTKAGDAANARLHRKHMASRMPAVRRYEAKINTCLNGARAEMLAKLAAHHDMTGRSVKQKAGAGAAFLFNLQDFAAEFTAAMDTAGRETYQDAGQQLYDELGQSDPWTAPPARVKTFLAERQNRLKDVPQEIFDQVQRQLDEGISAGDSTKDLASRISGEFDTISKGRAHTIAVTETGAAYGDARQASMQSAGVPYKKWLTSGNSNVRPAHADAEGQVRAIDEPYDVDDEEIDFPGDPVGSPENVINCHCVSIPEASGEGEDL
jgi:SPP1 gp7 family putative phage head morphogenesis protein